MAEQADRLQGQNRSAVTHPNSIHDRHCLIRTTSTQETSATKVRPDQVTNNTEIQNKSAGDRFKGWSALLRRAQELQYVSTLCLADSDSHRPTIPHDKVQVSPSRTEVKGGNLHDTRGR
ncbi:hypothetical protein J6590_087360 [Homalodisca vitripennis]|nr:hypothetical protein J6590_087360 [Homalodisca vitripennis]